MNIQTPRRRATARTATDILRAALIGAGVSPDALTVIARPMSDPFGDASAQMSQAGFSDPIEGWIDPPTLAGSMFDDLGITEEIPREAVSEMLARTEALSKMFSQGTGFWQIVAGVVAGGGALAGVFGLGYKLGKDASESGKTGNPSEEEFRDRYNSDPNADTDGDGVPDYKDGDIDGDGVQNDDDDFPHDPNESFMPIEQDTDGDGIPDHLDEGSYLMAQAGAEAFRAISGGALEGANLTAIMGFGKGVVSVALRIEDSHGERTAAVDVTR